MSFDSYKALPNKGTVGNLVEKLAKDHGSGYDPEQDIFMLQAGHQVIIGWLTGEDQAIVGNLIAFNAEPSYLQIAGGDYVTSKIAPEIGWEIKIG